ncbi:MAG: pyrroloquinoline quinone biosynthesis protein PqqB [Gammaproteobacteria bacterium]
MKIRVLGSAAGGGYPQWNCNHPNSRRARDGDPAASPRTQSSLAVSANEREWVLFNASPDLRQQIDQNSILHPKQGLRDSPIKAVVLTNADVDHVAGLLSLREAQPLRIYATQRIVQVLQANSIFNVLNPEYVRRQTMVLEKSVAILAPAGTDTGIRVVPFSVPGKVALWLENPGRGPDFGTVKEDTIALEVRDSLDEIKFFYVPACAEMTSELRERLRGALLVLFDGTLWRDDEMIVSGVGIKTGKRMGHMSASGDDGTLAQFRDLDVVRKVFIHINTTNPILLEDSKERAVVNAAGWEVAWDGMDIQI